MNKGIQAAGELKPSYRPGGEVDTPGYEKGWCKMVVLQIIGGLILGCLIFVGVVIGRELNKNAKGREKNGKEE